MIYDNSVNLNFKKDKVCFASYALTDRLAQLVEHRTTVREVAGSNPGRTTTQGL